MPACVKVLKLGRNVVLEWARGRVFDAEVGVMFQKVVQECRQVGEGECAEGDLLCKAAC
jgi:hypothetical protein